MNVIIFLSLLGTAFGLAIRFGGAPERWTAFMFLVATVMSDLLYQAPAERYYTVEVAVAFVDIALLFGLGAVLLKADRFWPIAMFAVHSVTVLSHLVKLLDASIVRHAYVIAIVSPGYATLLILIVAVIRHRQRLSAYGGDLDWSRSDGARQ